ncbi:MAG: GH36 C-terminal domain-containing protein [Clostridiales bacterium]|nr:GH36 C-terminal domain-containing protein [Clostridiales bacterium]
MIKVENDIFYLSAGETCYVFGLENGVPVHIYFGKRIEPEDDVRALETYGANKIAELTVQAVGSDGKKKDIDFVFDGAKVIEQDDKTLIVTLVSKKHGLKAHMHYTPHARGGISRYVVMESDGGAIELCSIKQSVGYGNDCKIVVADGYNNVTKDAGYFATATSDGLSEQNGDAYGFLCPAADGTVAAIGEAVSCDIVGTVAIEKGQIACPELLCVYSDNGMGGMTRIFHDILRESAEALFERSPTALFLPRQPQDKAISAVKTAVGMGFGMVAVDGGEYTHSAIQALAETCREQAITLGLRINSEVIYKDSALFTAACKKSGADGVYKYGTKDTLALFTAVCGIIAQNVIRYVTIDAPGAIFRAQAAHGMFMLSDRLTKEFSGLRVDFGIKSDKVKEFTFCYPLACVRNIISPLPSENFKQRFDCATMGTLGYELPEDISDGIKRAVRAQIFSYQDDALSVIRGDVYRQHDDGGAFRMAVSKDKSRAYAVCECKDKMRVKLVGLDEHNLYHVRELNKTFSGAALIHCGIPLNAAGTYVFHILQVADF